MEIDSDVVLPDIVKIERIGWHSHIHGLGLGGPEASQSHQSPTHTPELPESGLVGQTQARKAAGLVVQMIKRGQNAGKAVLLSGQPGTGKTALAIGVARELGSDIPFHHVSGSELFSLEFGKAEALNQALRKAMGVRIKEEVTLVRGEVVEIEVDEPTATAPSTPNNPKPETLARMVLKTTEMETLYELGTKMLTALRDQHITAGDIISIDRAGGKVTKLGRSFGRSKDYDAIDSMVNFIPTPEGEIQTKQNVTHTVSLHEIDVLNSRSHGFLALFSGNTGEIKSEMRQRIDDKIEEWRLEGKAELVRGVVFIDEVHMLDLEVFAYLSRAIEQKMAPVIIMASNRGITRIRGTTTLSPHGLPLDLLDRLLVIPTIPYTSTELSQIFNLRAQEEGYVLHEFALNLLVQLGSETSLRYVLQLATLARSLALIRRKKNFIIEDDIKYVYKVFLDVKRSSAYLQRFSQEYINQEFDTAIMPPQSISQSPQPV